MSPLTGIPTAATYKSRCEAQAIQSRSGCPAEAGAGPVTPAAAEVEVEAEPDVREDEEPVLAEAGLLLSEPEMPTESSEDEERPG